MMLTIDTPMLAAEQFIWQETIIGLTNNNFFVKF